MFPPFILEWNDSYVFENIKLNTKLNDCADELC